MPTVLRTYPRVAAWVGLTVAFVVLILVATLGRDLTVPQYVGLALVGTAVAGIAAGLAIDGPGQDAESARD